MSTEAQIGANRANAQQSTGPRNSEETRFNALKHGLLSKEVVVPRIEDRGEFEAIGARIRDCLGPQDVIEEILVERIIVAYWRIRRVIRAENGHIQDRNIPEPPPFETTLDDALNVFHKEDSPEVKRRRDEIGRQKGAARQYWEAIPTDSMLDILSRYETALERQVYRALKELQKYREMRT